MSSVNRERRSNDCPHAVLSPHSCETYPIAPGFHISAKLELVHFKAFYKRLLHISEQFAYDSVQFFRLQGAQLGVNYPALTIDDQ